LPADTATPGDWRHLWAGAHDLATAP